MDYQAILKSLTDERNRLDKAIAAIKLVADGFDTHGVTSTTPKRDRKRRRLSAAARKRISEATKARWAKQKAAAGKK